MLVFLSPATQPRLKVWRVWVKGRKFGGGERSASLAEAVVKVTFSESAITVPAMYIAHTAGKLRMLGLRLRVLFVCS